MNSIPLKFFTKYANNIISRDGDDVERWGAEKKTAW